MDDRLARRLRYPRPLEDGGYAVSPGFRWYRLGPEEFDRFSSEFAGLSWIRLADIVFASLWLLSTFVFSTKWTSPTPYFVLAALVTAVTWPRVSTKRFRSAFPQAKKVRVSSDLWFTMIGIWALAPVWFLIAAGSFVLGWGLAEMFPNAFMQDWRVQYGLEPGWPGYLLFSGFFFLVGSVGWGIRLYYRATRGCPLTYGNLIRTEPPASFDYTA